MEFHNKLYELRRQKGFSQEELANRLNVSRQTVSKWEVGESSPDMENLVAIGELFGVSLDELVLNKATTGTGAATEGARPNLYGDIKEHVLTDANKEKAKKGLKIAGIIVAAVLAVDIISMVVYFALFGAPK